jgi:hypothetical protein
MEHFAALQIALLLFWAGGSLVGCWFINRRLWAYFMSVTLSVPAIAYSMLGYGFLEFGGVLHALVAGVYALPIHFVFQRYRRNRDKQLKE